MTVLYIDKDGDSIVEAVSTATILSDGSISDINGKPGTVLSHEQQLRNMGIVNAKNLPILIMGGDHPYAQWWGTNGRNGLAGMYLDRNIHPYMAINTHEPGLSPGNTDMLTWAQIAKLQALGVEIVSHGAKHINNHVRVNTGLTISYNGAAATATVQITSTQILGVTAGGVADFTITKASIATLQGVTDAINAVSGWVCTMSPELSGTEDSANLLVVAARSAKATLLRVAAGGGINITYQSKTADSATFLIEGVNFQLFVNGIRKATFDTSNASYDTLTELVTAINAVSGFTAQLMDNAGQNSYISGSELSSNLVAPPHTNCYSRIVIVETGLTSAYMIRRNMELAKSTAAANGVSLKNYAQSGSGFYPFLVRGNDHGLFRGNSELTVPAPYPVSSHKLNYYLPHKSYSMAGNYDTAAKLQAIVDGLSASPQAIICGLIHDVITDATVTDGTVPGSSGYYLNGNSIGGDTTEVLMTGYLNAVKAAVDAGLIQTMTMEEARVAARIMPQQGNLIYNPKFKSDGTITAGADSLSSLGVRLPGWWYDFSPARVTSASIANDSLSITTTTAVASTLFASYISLEPGKTYDIGLDIAGMAYTSGSGVMLQLSSLKGRMKGMSTPDQGAIVSTNKTTRGESRMFVTVPNKDGSCRAKVVSDNTGPYDLSTNYNINLNIDGLNAFDINCRAGAGNNAAVTATEVAAAINAGITANANYPAEYRTCASVVQNRVVIQSPYQKYTPIGEVRVDAPASLPAGNTIFGATVSRAVGLHEQFASAEDYVFALNIVQNMIGSVTYKAPYCREVITT